MERTRSSDDVIMRHHYEDEWVSLINIFEFAFD